MIQALNLSCHVPAKECILRPTLLTPTGPYRCVPCPSACSLTCTAPVPHRTATIQHRTVPVPHCTAHLVPQVDEEPSIRANTTVLLGNVAKYLGEATCKRVLVNAFTRALKVQSFCM